MYKIIWAEYFNLQPINGVIEKDGQKYYFLVRECPVIACSVEGVPEPPPPDKCFNVYQVETSLIDQITEEHDNRCQQTGEPRRHGDPRYIMSNVTLTVPGRNSVTVQQLVDQITEQQIENFEVEHCMIF